jgi:hypothetical protein
MFSKQAVIDKIVEAEELGAHIETIKEKNKTKEERVEFSRAVWQWMLLSNDATNLINAAEEFLQEEDLVCLREQVNRLRPEGNVWQRYKSDPRKMVADFWERIDEIVRRRRNEQA